jgi:hypothetical protein
MVIEDFDMVCRKHLYGDARAAEAVYRRLLNMASRIFGSSGHPGIRCIA